MSAIGEILRPHRSGVIEVPREVPPQVNGEVNHEFLKLVAGDVPEGEGSSKVLGYPLVDRG